MQHESNMPFVHALGSQVADATSPIIVNVGGPGDADTPDVTLQIGARAHGRLEVVFRQPIGSGGEPTELEFWLDDQPLVARLNEQETLGKVIQLFKAGR